MSPSPTKNAMSSFSFDTIPVLVLRLLSPHNVKKVGSVLFFPFLLLLFSFGAHIVKMFGPWVFILFFIVENFQDKNHQPQAPFAGCWVNNILLPSARLQATSLLVNRKKSDLMAGQSSSIHPADFGEVGDRKKVFFKGKKKRKKKERPKKRHFTKGASLVESLAVGKY